MTDAELLIEQLAEAVSNCSEMLNGHDQMMDVLLRPGEISTKSPLTIQVDSALQAWREWKFG